MSDERGPGRTTAMLERAFNYAMYGGIANVVVPSSMVRYCGALIDDCICPDDVEFTWSNLGLGRIELPGGGIRFRPPSALDEDLRIPGDPLESVFIDHYVFDMLAEDRRRVRVSRLLEVGRERG